MLLCTIADCERTFLLEIAVVADTHFHARVHSVGWQYCLTASVCSTVADN